MGSYDFAEICELVGTFLLLLLRKKYNSNNIGLYRDDRLSVFKNISGLALSRVSYVMNIVNIANGVLFLFTWRRRFKNKISLMKRDMLCLIIVKISDHVMLMSHIVKTVLFLLQFMILNKLKVKEVPFREE